MCFQWTGFLTCIVSGYGHIPEVTGHDRVHTSCLSMQTHNCYTHTEEKSLHSNDVFFLPLHDLIVITYIQRNKEREVVRDREKCETVEETKRDGGSLKPRDANL